MAICKFCDKKMPPSVMKAHIKKRHSEELEVKRSPVYNQEEEVEEKKGDWNWGEINVCGQCKEEWPSRLMELHMAIRHGM